MDELIYRNNMSKSEAINVLTSLIEGSNPGEVRAKYLNMFEKLSLKNKKVFMFIEHLLVSDESQVVRATAAEVIMKLFPEDSVIPLKWMIQIWMCHCH